MGFLFFIPISTQARVFNMGSESFASYFKGTYGMSTIQQTAFGDSIGDNSTVAGEVGQNMSGEFGFVATGEKVSFKFGVEFITPTTVNSAGENAGGTKLYGLVSNISAMVTKVGFDFHIKQKDNWRLYLSAEGGTASVTVTNKYEFTADGTTTYSLADFTEKAKASGTLMAASLNYEILMTDTTTFTAEAGYRQLAIAQLKHDDDYTSFQGAKVSGDILQYDDGTDRALDFGGAFVGIGFRFYIK